MTRILATRLAQIAFTLAILSFCAFALIALMPGDPIEVAIAGDPRLTAEDAARLRALHGLDRPFHDRYLAWASGLLRGDFGYSRLFAQPVSSLLGPALLSTLALAGTALVIALVAGVALGAFAASRPRAAPFADAIAVMGQAMPTFWLGILLIIAFAVTLGWLPAGGAAEQGIGLHHLVLPVATLAIAHLAAYARHSAASLEATLTEPWIRSARARGASEARVLVRHAFPNAALPVLQIAALDAGALAGGALVTETVFARPGMGKLLYDAVMGNDTNLALVALLLVALVTMLATLGADLAQRALDPRLRER